MTGAFSQRADLRGLKKLMKQYPKVAAKALEKPAIQMLTWMNTGSPRESRTPPIKTGALRGSGSAFIGHKLVKTTPSTGGDSSPARSSEATDETVHWVFNTDYAAKMHEYDGAGGTVTQQAKDAGGKWMEKHVRADRAAFAQMFAGEFNKALNKLGTRI
jgi:hypothetical protein